MARKPPPDSAHARFATLLAGHLSAGTRPSTATGEPWTDAEFASELPSKREASGYASPRSISNWRKGAALPERIEPILRALFGPPNNARHLAVREALREAFVAARTEKLNTAKRNAAGVPLLTPQTSGPEAPRFTFTPPVNHGANWKPNPSYVDEEKDAESVFRDCASSYKLLVKQDAPVRLTQVDYQQLRMLSEQYLLPIDKYYNGSSQKPRSALACIADLLPALAKRRAVITDRTKAATLDDPTVIFEQTSACKLTLPPACLAHLPGLTGMTVWVSEAKTQDLEHFNTQEPFVASGCYLYLVQPDFGYTVNHAPSVVSGRTALQWILVNGSRDNGLRSPVVPHPENVDFSKSDPVEALLSLGAIPGPQRDIITLYWPVWPSNDQMFTLRDGRLCRTYDLLGYPIFIVEP